MTTATTLPATDQPGDQGFYRHLIHVEVLSRGALRGGDLDILGAVRYAVTEGDCSGAITTEILNEPVTTDVRAGLLETHDRDPGFFAARLGQQVRLRGGHADEGS